jgi:hypothetical protein
MPQCKRTKDRSYCTCPTHDEDSKYSTNCVLRTSEYRGFRSCATQCHSSYKTRSEHIRSAKKRTTHQHSTFGLQCLKYRFMHWTDDLVKRSQFVIQTGLRYALYVVGKIAFKGYNGFKQRRVYIQFDAASGRPLPMCGFCLSAHKFRPALQSNLSLILLNLGDFSGTVHFDVTKYVIRPLHHPNFGDDLINSNSYDNSR